MSGKFRFSYRSTPVVLFVFLVWFSGCGGSSPGGGSGREVVLADSDGIFTMSPSGSQPVFRYVGKHGRTYVGFYNSKNEIPVMYYDAGSSLFSTPATIWSDWGYSSGGIFGDDHANPAIIVLSNQDDEEENGKILVAAAEHGHRLESRKSAKAEDISAWEDPIVVAGTKATYARLIELNDGKVWLLVRLSNADSNAKATFFLFTSEDAGDSWTGPELVVDTDDIPDSSALYLTTAYDKARGSVHFMFNLVKYDDPVEGVQRYQDIYYANYDHERGRWLDAEGSEIGTGMPLILGDADLVCKTDGEASKEDWQYLSDIKTDKYGRPFLLSINDPDRGDFSDLAWRGDAEILRHRWTNGTWMTEKVGKSARFHYPNMATFEYGKTDVVYGFPPNANGYGELTRFQRMEDGTWREEGITSGTVGNHHARPFAVIDGGDGYPPSRIKLFWCLIAEDYGGSPYIDWTSSVYALF